MSASNHIELTAERYGIAPRFPSWPGLSRPSTSSRSNTRPDTPSSDRPMVGGTARMHRTGSPRAHLGVCDAYGLIDGLPSPPPLWGRLGRGAVPLGRSPSERAAPVATPHPGPPPQGGREFAAPAVRQSSPQSLLFKLAPIETGPGMTKVGAQAFKTWPLQITRLFCSALLASALLAASAASAKNTGVGDDAQLQSGPCYEALVDKNETNPTTAPKRELGAACQAEDGDIDKAWARVIRLWGSDSTDLPDYGSYVTPTRPSAASRRNGWRRSAFC